MNADEVARRYAHARTGYELVSYREVALPLFRVDCDMLILEEKPVPPIQEYVLRAVALGMDDLQAVSGLLGVQEPVARATAAELLRTDNLLLEGGADSARHRLALTAKGRQTAEAAAQVQAVEVDLPVFIDGLTRQVVSVSGRGLGAFPAGQASSRGLVEIAAFPRRRPGLEEIPFDVVRAAIARESAGRRARREVIGIVGMGKARRYAREGVALAYHSPREEELLISLVVDGALSEQHDAAFGRARARSARRLAPEQWTSAEELARRELSAELLEQAAPPEQAERLRDDQQDLARERQSLADAAERAAQDELQALRQRLDEAERRAKQLQVSLDNISVRQVAVYEHRDYLERALTEARRRVMIVSPWIRYEVVNNELLSRLRKLLERKVELWIAYGIVPKGGCRAGKKGEADRDAEQALRRIADDYPHFHMTRLGDTHAKVLICDSRFSVVTSFNWLSFRGDSRLEFRDERGYYVGLTEKVDELFESYRIRFEGERADGASE